MTARSGGELKFDMVASLRSCCQEFQVPSRAKRSSPVMLVQNTDTETAEDVPDAGDQVVFSEVEALLAEYGVQDVECSEHFFPSNAFMASARSSNTFNCMLQIRSHG